MYCAGLVWPTSDVSKVQIRPHFGWWDRVQKIHSSRQRQISELKFIEESIRNLFDSVGLIGKDVQIVRGSTRFLSQSDADGKSQDSLVKLMEALEKITS